MITEIKGKCQHEGCELDAVMIAGSNDQQSALGVYCKTHGDLIAKINYPEYTDICPNCGCHFGVN
jgi:hypothetical protein